MKFKGTRAPWTIEISNDERFSIKAPDRGLFIDVWGVGIAQVETREEVQANAQLIAAAPDLLEALNWVANSDEAIDNMELGQIVQQAINKALGTTQSLGKDFFKLLNPNL
jgi:hypothetical protein